MPLRPVPFREVHRHLLAAGFEVQSQRGCQVKFLKRSGTEVRVAIVPNHREVAIGMLRNILRQAGISIDDFEQL